MRSTTVLLTALVAAACTATAHTQEKRRTLLDKRKGHKTKLVRVLPDEEDPLEEPPKEWFKLIKYKAPVGPCAAYVSVPPDPAKRGPAIVWLTGGFPVGGAGDSAWTRQPVTNDQGASIYRAHGIVMMYPSLRGTFGNPGKQESFYGEVEDVIAAAKHLASLPYVDPKQIYLGGHSTGGTMALLVAQSTDLFRAAFCFGPSISPRGYGAEAMAYDVDNEKENELRSPLLHVDCIQTPTWVIEGTIDGNLESLEELRKMGSAVNNPLLHCLAIVRGNHFDILAPLNRLIAERITKLKPGATFRLGALDALGAVRKQQQATREANELETLAELRRARVDFVKEQTVQHYLLSRERAGLEKAAAAATKVRLTPTPIAKHEDREGKAYYVLIVEAKIMLGHMPSVFTVAEKMERIHLDHGLQYDGWGVK
jgi:acetyl esterase/lipase